MLHHDDHNSTSEPGISKSIQATPSALYRNLLLPALILCHEYQILAEMRASSCVLAGSSSMGGSNRTVKFDVLPYAAGLLSKTRVIWKTILYLVGDISPVNAIVRFGIDCSANETSFCRQRSHAFCMSVLDVTSSHFSLRISSLSSARSAFCQDHSRRRAVRGFCGQTERVKQPTITTWSE